MFVIQKQFILIEYRTGDYGRPSGEPALVAVLRDEVRAKRIARKLARKSHPRDLGYEDGDWRGYGKNRYDVVSVRLLE